MYFRGCLHIQIFVTSKFLGIDISNNLSCAQHILHAIAKKAIAVPLLSYKIKEICFVSRYSNKLL